MARDYLALLGFARRAKYTLDGDTTVLDKEITRAHNRALQLAVQAGTPIEPRRRMPKKVFGQHDPRPEYIIFLDECGVHDINPLADPFPVFCLCAVLVPSRAYATFDALWKGWKARWLGSPEEQVHEPDVRHRSRRFYRSDPTEQHELLDALSQQLTELDFHCIAAVIDKAEFAAQFTDLKVDDFLPRSCYLMCVDFVFERVVHFLHHVGGDARGIVQAESRGPREDAEVHSEFLRLHLQGTQWQPDTQFRHQLRPYIEFMRKHHNVSGLQIADLAARPIAERILRPDVPPARWDIIEPRVYDGGKGRKFSYGLKVFPSTSTALRLVQDSH